MGEGGVSSAWEGRGADAKAKRWSYDADVMAGR